MTIRSQVFDAIAAAVEALDDFGRVFPAGEDGVTFADTLQGTGGKHVVELGLGEDRVIAGDQGRTTNVIRKEFDVVFVVHLAPAIIAGSDVRAAAENAYADIVALYGSYDPSVGTWGVEGVETTLDDGGGGVSHDQFFDTRVTAVYAKVLYRHAPGVP